MWRSIPRLIKSNINYAGSNLQIVGIKMSNLKTIQIYEKQIFMTKFSYPKRKLKKLILIMKLSALFLIVSILKPVCFCVLTEYEVYGRFERKDRA